jgi:hypothetical protein
MVDISEFLREVCCALERGRYLLAKPTDVLGDVEAAASKSEIS